MKNTIATMIRSLNVYRWDVSFTQLCFVANEPDSIPEVFIEKTFYHLADKCNHTIGPLYLEGSDLQEALVNAVAKANEIDTVNKEVQGMLENPMPTSEAKRYYTPRARENLSKL